MLWLMLGMWGCGAGGMLVPTGFDVAIDPTVPEVPVLPMVNVDVSVADPLQGEVSWSAEGLNEAVWSVQVTGVDGVVLSEEIYPDLEGRASGTWDGKLLDGGWAGAGWFTLSLLEYDNPVASVEVGIVRAGTVEAYAEHDAGETAQRLAMFWWRDEVLQDGEMPVSALPGLEHPVEGTALDYRWVDFELESGLNMTGTHPVAYTHDSRPLITLRVGDGSQTALGATGLNDVPVWIEAEGWTALDDAPMSDGGWVTLQRDLPLSEDGTVGITEEEVVLEFVVEDKSGPQVIGQQVLPMRFFRMLGEPTFGWEGSKYNPWAAPMFELLQYIEGTPAEHDEVANAVVDYVYHELGLAYDIERGASAYSDYSGWGWNDPHFYFTEFLDREWGTIINCTDAGNLTTTYANMVGAELRHLIILESFALKEIKGIGLDYFTSCPFGPGGCGFSYHAVTTDDSGETIWDATLMLDGDDDPGEAPHEEMPVFAVDGEEYLDRLSHDGDTYYDYENRGTIQ
jgi:hypothetical protein